MKTLTCNVVNWTKAILEKNHQTKVVIGISGGKDSSVVAAICAKAIGPENVIGVMMPCGIQKDIGDSQKLIDFLGIKSTTVNIGNAFNDLCNAINLGVELSYDTKTNLPARLRMSTLYAVAQTVGGFVANTCNLSEDYAPGGYATLFGDNAGSFAPIQDMTVSEVIEVGEDLGLPYNLLHKTPIDGLQPLSDEEKIAKQTGIEGWTYARFDKLIRGEKHDFTPEEVEILRKGAQAGKFKRDIVQIPKFKTHRPNIFDVL